MARRGDMIENPLTGERVTFLETTRDTGGELLRFEYVLPTQEERHEVISGTLRGRLGGRERTYGEGERVIGPAGVPHAWRNASDREELRIVSELRPALHMEALLETSFDVMRAWKANKMGAPRYLLQLAILTDEVRDDLSFTGVPRPVWRAFMAASGLFARLGRMLGYGTRYPR